MRKRKRKGTFERGHYRMSKKGTERREMRRQMNNIIQKDGGIDQTVTENKEV